MTDYVAQLKKAALLAAAYTVHRGTPALQIGNPGAVAYDTKRDEILVPN